MLEARSFVNYFYDGRSSESYDFAGTDTVKGASFDYDALNGHRVQVGTLLTYAYSDAFRPFIGLTVEGILKAEATGTAKDDLATYDLKSSDMEGVTGILTMGWKYVSGDGKYEFGISANGLAGARAGANAQIQSIWRW